MHVPFLWRKSIKLQPFEFINVSRYSFCFKGPMRGRVGWLVVLGLTALLRQYFSLYRAVSQRKGEREEKR